MEGSVHEAKPLRRGFLRKGGGRHDPDDAEVVVMIIEILYPLVMTKQTTQFLQCLSRYDICNPKPGGSLPSWRPQRCRKP